MKVNPRWNMLSLPPLCAAPRDHVATPTSIRCFQVCLKRGRRVAGHHTSTSAHKGKHLTCALHWPSLVDCIREVRPTCGLDVLGCSALCVDMAKGGKPDLLLVISKGRDRSV